MEVEWDGVMIDVGFECRWRWGKDRSRDGGGGARVGYEELDMRGRI